MMVETEWGAVGNYWDTEYAIVGHEYHQNHPNRVIRITITIYVINPSGKLKLSFDRTTKNISQSF